MPAFYNYKLRDNSYAGGLKPNFRIVTINFEGILQKFQQSIFRKNIGAINWYPRTLNLQL